MVKAKQYTCPCGFSVTSPYGTDDVMKHAAVHGSERHPDTKTSKDQMMEMVKEVEIEMPGSGKARKGVITQKEETDAWRIQERIGKGIR